MTGGLIRSHRTRDGLIYDFGCECDEGWLEMIADLIRELLKQAGHVKSGKSRKNSVAFVFKLMV